MVDSSGCRSIECAPVILPDQELVFRNFTGNPVCGSVVRPLLFRDLSSFTGNVLFHRKPGVGVLESHTEP